MPVLVTKPNVGWNGSVHVVSGQRPNMGMCVSVHVVSGQRKTSAGQISKSGEADLLSNRHVLARRCRAHVRAHRTRERRNDQYINRILQQVTLRLLLPRDRDLDRLPDLGAAKSLRIHTRAKSRKTTVVTERRTTNPSRLRNRCPNSLKRSCVDTATRWNAKSVSRSEFLVETMLRLLHCDCLQ